MVHPHAQKLTQLWQEQPDLFEDVPDHSRDIGLNDLERFPPTQAVLWFYDSMTAKPLVIFEWCLEEAHESSVRKKKSFLSLRKASNP